MALTSRQRRLLSEQDPKAVKPAPTPGPEEVSPAPEKALDGAKAPPVPEKPEEGNGELGEGPSGGKVNINQGLKAIEKLQGAAADIEGARFVIQNVFSDFSLSRKLERLKQELVLHISKAREHATTKAAESPEAQTSVAKWLGVEE
jgi:hypothetical protein